MDFVYTRLYVSYAEWQHCHTKEFYAKQQHQSACLSGSCVLATEEGPRNLVDHKAGGHAHASTESYIHLESVTSQLS